MSAHGAESVVGCQVQPAVVSRRPGTRVDLWRGSVELELLLNRRRLGGRGESGASRCPCVHCHPARPVSPAVFIHAGTAFRLDVVHITVDRHVVIVTNETSAVESHKSEQPEEQDSVSLSQNIGATRVPQQGNRDDRCVFY